jgi:hypothetical protein
MRKVPHVKSLFQNFKSPKSRRIFSFWKPWTRMLRYVFSKFLQIILRSPNSIALIEMSDEPDFSVFLE